MAALGVPLLHVAQTGVESTTVDGGFVVGASAAFVAGTLAVWRRRALASVRRFADRRRYRRFARVCAGLLMALAVLPAIMPYDHLLPRASASSTTVERGTVAVHESHCHGTTGSCADAPVSAGPGQVLASDPLIVVPVLLSVALLSPAVVLIGIARRPDVPVPLPALAA